MKKNTIIKLFNFFIIFIFSAITQAKAPYIQDYAKIVSPEKVAQLESNLSSLETEHSVLVQEVILPHLAGRSEEAIVNGFLQLLKQESPHIDKKVLLLIILDSKKVVIFNTANLAQQMNEQLKSQITRSVNAKLTIKKYDDMATVGVTKISKAVKTTPQSRNKMILNIIFFLVALGIVVGLIKYKNSV